jgi:hypothetical protein
MSETKKNAKKPDLLDVVVDQIAAKLRLSDQAKEGIRVLQPATLGELLLGEPAPKGPTAAAKRVEPAMTAEQFTTAIKNRANGMNPADAVNAARTKR